MPDARDAIARRFARHSLGWLLAANLVGLWLAATLVWPALGDVLAPLTFGRWVPLHLDWQLYGWCALPLAAALAHWMIDARHPRSAAHAGLVLWTWSAALAAGGAWWLGGHSSGKIFVEWSGAPRWLIAAALGVFWSVLAAHTWWRRDTLARPELLVRSLLLAGLSLVPPALFLSAGRDFYPAVNPDSGGATGAALLGSTLVVVTLFGALPRLLGRPAIRVQRWFWPATALSWLAFLVVRHGDASHHDLAQILALGLLLAWVPLLVVRWRAYQWTEGTRAWLVASAAWWLVLVVSGWVTFLPGFSERLKFTNGLVAHAHLAMAGLATSVNGVILQSLARGLDARGPFWLWQGGCALFVLLMLTLGARETADAEALFDGAAWTQALYSGRLVAGAAMAVASVCWFRRSLRA